MPTGVLVHQSSYPDFFGPVSFANRALITLTTGQIAYIPIFVATENPSGEPARHWFVDGADVTLSLASGTFATTITGTLVRIPTGSDWTAQVAGSANGSEVALSSATAVSAENALTHITPTGGSPDANRLTAGDVLALKLTNGTGGTVTGHVAGTAMMRNRKL